MPLELTDNIISFDIETTGLDKSKDRIIQLGAIKYTKNWKKVAIFNYMILPTGEWEMSPDAEATHGFSKEYVEETGVPLVSVYQEWLDFINGCDIITFNGNSFDIPFMYADFAREGLDPKIIENRLIDSYLIEKAVNSNTLESAYTRYTGLDPDTAHNAASDAKMTIRVFQEQMNRYDISEILQPKDMKMDFPESILSYNDDGRIQLMGGKHKDSLIFDVIKKDPSYIKWLFGNVLSKPSKDKVMEEYNQLK